MLLKGKKNIGHNIRLEESHGRPHAQALAIALSKAYGKKKPHKTVLSGHRR